LIDVAEAIARQVLRLYGTQPNEAAPSLRLLASAHPERLRSALPAMGLGLLNTHSIHTKQVAI
jgi:hypothetical protein